MTSSASPPPEGDAPEPLPAPGGRSAVDFGAVYQIIDRHFKIYEFDPEIRGLPRGEVAAYYVHTDSKTFTQTFEQLRTELRQKFPDLVIVLQNRMGEDVLLVARKPQVPEKGVTIHVVLLLLTILTTTISGAIFYQPIDGAKEEWMLWGADWTFLLPRMLFWGFVTFSLPLMLILGIHELGHFFVARRHHVKTTLPYFIPVPPPVPLGTFGAFISMREPIPDRKALFDIGASGPLVGFLLAIPVVFLGMLLTAYQGAPVPAEPEIHGSVLPPGGDPVYGYGGTAVAGESLYVQRNESRDDGEWHVEEIRVWKNASLEYSPNKTYLPQGAWTLRASGFNMEDAPEQIVHVRIELMELNTTSIGDADLNRTEAEVKVTEDQTNATFTFEIHANNVTEVRAVLEWKDPPSGVVKLGSSILFLGLQYVVNAMVPLDDEVYTHPTGIAGWVGLLVTGFNLLPAGQLDGGHVARAVLGDRMRWASYASVLIMVALSLRFFGWLVMAILIVFLGLNHPPPLNDKSPLDGRRKFVAVLVLLVLIVTFVPFPFVPVD